MGATLAAERALWLAEHVLPCERGLRDWLRRRMAQPQDVDDVVQETYAILAALADVSHVRQPRAYVYQVAQSVVLQQLRRAQVVSMEMVAEFDRLPITGEDASPERLASSRQELNTVTALIAQLPDKCRQAFILRRVEGFSQREIAERMQISENTVEKHVCKGIRLLMESMKQEAGQAGSTGKPDTTEAVHARRR
ncbi:putative RNA polymerase sigma factor FecI [compost metagenome]|nr:RNA polymerase subunit sigma-24 [Stenotrophomonas sp.]